MTFGDFLLWMGWILVIMRALGPARLSWPDEEKEWAAAPIWNRDRKKFDEYINNEIFNFLVGWIAVIYSFGMFVWILYR